MQKWCIASLLWQQQLTRWSGGSLSWAEKTELPTLAGSFGQGHLVYEIATHQQLLPWQPCLVCVGFFFLHPKHVDWDLAIYHSFCLERKWLFLVQGFNNSEFRFKCLWRIGDRVQLFSLDHRDLHSQPGLPSWIVIDSLYGKDGMDRSIWKRNEKIKAFCFTWVTMIRFSQNHYEQLFLCDQAQWRFQELVPNRFQPK